MSNADEFWAWVESQLKAHKLSYYRIEQEQGLGNATISRPARFEQQPTLMVCSALAEAFGYPLEEVLRRAGHLPPRPAGDGLRPEMQARVARIVEMLLELEEIAPDMMESVLNLFYLQAESHRAAARASRRALEGEGDPDEPGPEEKATKREQAP